MRQDIDKIVKLIVKYTDVKAIDIPTNCLLDIREKFEKILRENPTVNFTIVCSLDGLEETHDFIRGVKGGFKRTVEMIRKLNDMKKRYSNFRCLNVNSVISDRNSWEIRKLANFVKTLPVDNHSFDIIRGSHQQILKTPEIREIGRLNRIRYETAKFYNGKKPFLKRIFYNLKEKEIFGIQHKVLKGGKWPFECTAGATDFVIESDGTARICELQPVVGNLLEKTPEEILRSQESGKIFRQIKAHSCDCTHICNLYSSADFSLGNLFQRLF